MLALELARSLAVVGEAEETEVHFTRALQLAPRDPRNRSAFARWLAVRGRGPEAVEELNAAAAIGPADANVRWFLMNLLGASGD